MRPTRITTHLLLSTAIVITTLANAEVPEFTPKITDVTVFKDGHTLVMARGEAKLKDGWCRTREVPAPLLGAFWTFVAEEGFEVDFVKAGFADAQESRPCLTFEEIIQANAGKHAIIVEHPKDADAVSHEGVLLGILEHEVEREVETSETRPSTYDRWGGYVPNQTVREAKEEKVESLASFVMLKKEGGVQLIKRENIRSICLAEEDPITEHKGKTKVREIGIHVASKGAKLPDQAEVGMVFIQRGVRWIPDYRIELLANGKAKVSLQGTVINDLADMENVDLRLVVGVPSFVMKDALSPMALRDIGLRLSSYFAPPSWRRGETRADYLSNALMSQAVLPSRSEGSPELRGGPHHEDTKAPSTENADRCWCLCAFVVQMRPDSFKDKPVHLYVTRKAVGTATNATADGKITQSNTVEDTSIPQEGAPWYWWNWPWWYYGVNPISEITWDTVVRPGQSATFAYDWYYYCP